jgi:C4-dicarboxylate-specific signal transduction histidine kinase
VDARTFDASANDDVVANCFWAETPSGPKWCGFFASDNMGPGRWRKASVVEMRRSEGRRDTSRDDRLAQLGAMASTLSHELKQPLATIAFAAENGKLRLVGQTDTRSQKALEKFDKILEQVERARDITGKMLAHAKAEADANAEFDLEAAIRAAQSQASGLMMQADIQYGELTIAEHASIIGLSRLSFELIMLNGIRNAIQAIGEARAKHLVTRGRIDITSRRIGNGSIAVSIIDDGAGISPEIADKLFSPFATSKKGEDGNGIGLHMCRQLLEKIGGTLDLVSNPDARGARLVMTFPEKAVRFTSLGNWQQS